VGEKPFHALPIDDNLSPESAREFIPWLIAKVLLRGLMSLKIFFLVLFRGLKLLDRGFNPWRTIGFTIGFTLILSAIGTA
jgi:hypothetical protein